MPGLLDGWSDFIRTPEGQGLLSAAFGGLAGARRGEPINSMGRAGLAGLSGYSGAQDRELQLADHTLKRSLTQSQIDENVSQNLTRAQALKQQAAKDAYFMGTPGADIPAMPTSPGAFKPPADGMGPVMPAMLQAPQATTPAQAPSMGKFDEWSKQFGIPKDALMADYNTNGGKGIADMLYKRGAPDMQVTGGYAYDKNKQGAGFMPSLTTSTNGQTSMTRIGADGLPIISAPQGALKTAEDYKLIDSGIKPMKVFDPKTQTEVYTTERKVVEAASGAPAGYATEPQMKTTAGGDIGGSRAEVQREIKQTQADLMKPMDEKSKVMLREHLAFNQQKLADPRYADKAPAGNFAAGPSAAEALATKAAETRAVATASADVVRDTSDKKQLKSATEMLSDVTRAKELLKMGPTASGIGETADKVAGYFGKTLPGAEIASKLDIVAGSLTKNVPRMEGPQSNTDLEEYKTNAGRVANRSLPTDVRMAAAEEVERLQKKYIHLNGGETTSAPATPKTSFTESGYKNEAAAIKDAQNAIMRGASRDAVQKRLESMGLSLPNVAKGRL